MRGNGHKVNRAHAPGKPPRSLRRKKSPQIAANELDQPLPAEGRVKGITVPIEPKWQLGERLLKEVKASVEKGYLTPLDGPHLVDQRDALRLRRVHLARDLARDVARDDAYAPIDDS
jgi:hypothetical protein